MVPVIMHTIELGQNIRISTYSYLVSAEVKIPKNVQIKQFKWIMYIFTMSYNAVW